MAHREHVKGGERTVNGPNVGKRDPLISGGENIVRLQGNGGARDGGSRRGSDRSADEEDYRKKAYAELPSNGRAHEMNSFRAGSFLALVAVAFKPAIKPADKDTLPWTRGMIESVKVERTARQNGELRTRGIER
jgi:hypothetical protein